MPRREGEVARVVRDSSRYDIRADPGDDDEIGELIQGFRLSRPLALAMLVAFFWFMQRRAQSQMGGIMSIGRSKAKTYSTERPGTTFADVDGSPVQVITPAVAAGASTAACP